MMSIRKAGALFIGSVLVVSAIAQTKAGEPVQTNALPSARLSSSGRVSATQVPQASASIPPSRMLPQPQPGQPAISAVQGNGAVFSVPAPVNPQASPQPKPASATIVVDYRNGLLSVVADKAELGKVLQLVGAKIGTPIEVAPEISADPVVAHLGPASPTHVLAQLLDGPQLEYIVMSSDESGQILNRVIVRRRSSFARQPLVAIKAPAAPATAGESK